MPKIRIYCCNDRYFLVIGEEYLNDILYGKLTDFSDVEIVDTDDYNKVLSEWENFNPNSTPWMIHPNIGAELRERLAPETAAIEPDAAKPAALLRRRPIPRYKISRGDFPGRRG